MVFGTFWRKRVFVAGLALAATAVTVTGVPAAASPGGGGLRPVSYLGYTFRIPANWAVIHLAAHPRTCVRFNRNALYLGSPSTRQACPAGLVGVADAMLVQPATSSSATRSVEDPVAHRIGVATSRIEVSAAYRGSPAQILAILSSAGLPPPSISDPAKMATRLRGGPHVLPGGATSGTGFGFDTCSAPSARVMHAWLLHSHYRGIGVYIGGSDRACAQPALTPNWLSSQAAAGWRFIPLYVGPQVSFGEVGAPVRQAAAAAQDAVVQARRLGFGPGSPIYYDMEAYGPDRSKIALKFFSVWTTELHALGYRSAIYSSSLSGIRDLGLYFRKGVYAMPDVIYDAWWNGVPNTVDPNIPAGAWANHQRVHQYAGSVQQSHGGFGLNIDKDFLDVRAAGGGPPPPALRSATRQASQAVATPHGTVDAFYTGTDRALWYVRYRPGKGWSAPARLAAGVRSQPSAVTLGGTVYVFYRARGALHYRKSQGTRWSRPVRLRARQVSSGPAAVSASNGNIQVFWRGRDRRELWQAGYMPRHGWRGPHLLATNLVSVPGAAVSGSGRISVFWKGADGRLWHTSRRQGHPWHVPTALRAGRPGTGPRATGQLNSEIQVVWGAKAHSGIWHAAYTRATGWSHPSHIGGGLVGKPFAVATAAGSESAFWVGGDHRLWQAVSGKGTGWSHASPLPLGKAGGHVLFAASQPNGVIDVFWRGRGNRHLWHARYSPRQHWWAGPDDLGGSVG